MNKYEYKKTIIEDMKALCIYQPQYDILIDTLAQTCEFRDKNMEEWKKAGGQMVILYTNKGGATNPLKTPYYMNNLQFNEQILKYCKELCISPSGMNKLGHPNDEGKDDFEEFMDEIS